MLQYSLAHARNLKLKADHVEQGYFTYQLGWHQRLRTDLVGELGEPYY